MIVEPVMTAVFVARGAEAHLTNAVRSVLHQTLQNIEIVIVTGSPRSQSFAVASRLREQDQRVRVLSLGDVPTLGCSLEAGLKAAHGKFVAFPEADGLVPDGAYEEAVECLEGGGADVACGHVVAFGARRGFVHNAGVIPDHPVRGAELERFAPIIRDDAIWDKVYRRAFIADRGLSFEAESPFADRLFVVRAAVASSKIAVVQNAVAWHRIHRNEQSDARSAREWLEFVAVCLDAVGARGRVVSSAYADGLIRSEFIRPGFLRAVQEPDVCAVAQSVITRSIEIADESTLASLTIDLRWALALAASGHISTALSLLEAPVPRAEEEIRSAALDAIPAGLSSVLGLGEHRVSDAFRSRVLGENAGSRTSPPAPALKTAPDISVIVPTHNVAPYIDELLDSIRAARDVALEILVVDDGSSDGTRDRVLKQSLADQRVRLFRSPGQGGGQARNYGVELARGEYIAFADGDDLVPPAAYSAMMRAAQDTRADVVTASYLKFFVSSTWNAVDGYSYAYRRRVEDVALATHPQLTRHRACWNRLFRRDFWMQNAFAFPGVPRANDIVAVVSALSAAAHITVIPDVSYVYRDRPGLGSMTSAVGAAAYTMSYFAEEETCARMLGQLDSVAIDREYWSMVLATDGWGNLQKYLSVQESRDFEEGDAISALVRRILALAPAAALAALTPEQQVLWHLAGAGEWHRASILSRVFDGDAGQPLPTVIDAVQPLTDIAELASRAIGWVTWKYVFRRIVDDSTTRTNENLRDAADLFFDRLTSRGINVPLLPTAREYRIWRALERGPESVLRAWDPGLAVVEATLADGLRSARLSGAVPLWITDARIIAVHDRDDSAKYPLAVVRPGSRGEWAVTLDADCLPERGRWRLWLEYEDEWGTAARARLQMSAAARNRILRRFGRIAPVPTHSQLVTVRASLAVRAAQRFSRRSRR